MTGSRTCCWWAACIGPTSRRGARHRPRLVFFRGLPPGRERAFADATAESGLGLVAHGYAALAFDIDGDGDRDVFITTLEGARLYVNDGRGHFRDETRQRGLTAEVTGGWTTALAPFDVDDDGDLDLFVGRYVTWSRQADDGMGCTTDGTNRAWCLPTLFPATTPALLINDGRGHFRDGTEQARMPQGASRALGVLTVDLDGDGRLDLMVANDMVRNQVLLNHGDGTLTEVAVPMGFAATEGGSVYAGMGISGTWHAPVQAPGQAPGSTPGELSLCIAIANFAGEPITVHCRAASTGAGAPRPFLNREAALGVRQPTVAWVKFGLLWMDADLDGRDDLFVVSGDVSDQEKTIGRPLREPMQFLWAAGSDHMVDASTQALGPLASRGLLGRAAATLDLDADGDLDVIVTENDGEARLVVNRTERRGHWVRLDLVGAAPNIDAIGAQVEVVAGERRYRTWVHATGSFMAQSSLARIVGLGEFAGTVDVTVDWPDGRRQGWRGLAVDQRHRLVEDRSAPTVSRAAPVPIAETARTRAMAARAQGDLDAEITRLEEAVIESPFEPEVYRELAWANWRAGRKQRALDAAALAAEHSGDSTAVVNRLCIELEKRGAIELAGAAAERALRVLRDPSGRLWASAGMYREASGDRAGADEAFRAAVRLLPDDIEVAQNRARYLNRGGRSAEAIALLEPLLARDPRGVRDAGFHDDLGVAYLAAGRRAEAEREFLRAIDLAQSGTTLDARLRARAAEDARLHLQQVKPSP